MGRLDEGQTGVLDREMTDEEIVEVFEQLDLPTVPPPEPEPEVRTLVTFHVSGDSR